MQKRHLGLGIFYAIIAAFVFAFLGAIIKLATADLNPPMIFFGRQLFSLLTILPFLSWWSARRGLSAIQTKHLSAHITRAIISLSAGYCLMFTLALIPLSNAITLSYTRPLFLPLLIWIVMGKRIEMGVWVGLIIGFVGVALILKPRLGVLELGTLTGLGAGILGSGAVLAIRRLAKTEPPPRILGYYFLISTIITTIVALLLWETPTWQLWLGLFGIGILGACYQLFLTLAYRHGRATLISGVLYSAVVFTLFWDWLFWNHLPDWWSIGGIALICSGAIIALITSKSPAAPGEQPTTAR